MDRATRDRACEWVNENYPHLDGAAWEEAVLEAMADLLAIDEHEDAREAI